MALANQYSRSPIDFSSTLPGRELLEEQLIGQRKASLMKEAKDRLPDFKAFSDALIKEDMHFANAMEHRQNLDNVTNAYLQRYTENPLSMLKPENARWNQTLSAAANNPAIKRDAEVFKRNKEVMTNVREDNISHMYNVSGGRVRALNHETKTLTYVNPEDIDGKKYTPLTFEGPNGQWDVIDNFLGAGEQGGNTVDRTIGTIRDVNDEIRSAFIDLGSEKWNKIFYDVDRGTSSDNMDVSRRGAFDVDVSQKSNLRNVNIAKNSLMENGRLSQKSLDTLFSMYYSKTGDFNRENAGKFVMQYMDDYAKGRITSERDIDVRESEANKAAATSASLGKASVIQSALNSPYVSVYSLTGGRGDGTAGRVVDKIQIIPPSAIFDPANSTNVIGEGVNARASRRFTDLKFFSEGTTQNVQAIAERRFADPDDPNTVYNAGDPVNLDQTNIQDIVVLAPGDKIEDGSNVRPIGFSPRYYKADGTPMTQSEAELLTSYIEPQENGEFKVLKEIPDAVADKLGLDWDNQTGGRIPLVSTVVSFDALVKKRTGAFGGLKDEYARRNIEALEKAGGRTLDSKKALNTYNNLAGDYTSGESPDLSAPWYAANDEVIRTRLQVEVRPPEQMMMAVGDDVYAPKSQSDVRSLDAYGSVRRRGPSIPTAKGNTNPVNDYNLKFDALR